MNQELQDKLTPLFDQFFRFKVGEVVIEKATADYYRARIAAGETFGGTSRFDQQLTMPMGVTVLERHLKQCHGGISQGFYLVAERQHDTRGMMITQIAEPLLVAYSELAEAIKAARKEPA